VPSGEWERMNIAIREGGLEALKKTITKERNEEINREMMDFQFKIMRDQLLSSEAAIIVNNMQLFN
jgi:hypothetical protein